MKVYIWDKEFHLPTSIENDDGWPRLTKLHLKQIKDLIQKETASAKKDYNEKLNDIKKGSLADFSKITKNDSKALTDFIDYIKGDSKIIWPSFYEPLEDDSWDGPVGYEWETWRFIDLFTISELCKFKNCPKNLDDADEDDMVQILSYAFCPELLEVAGRQTTRLIFAKIILFTYSTDSCEPFNGYLGEFQLQNQLIPLIKRLISFI